MQLHRAREQFDEAGAQLALIGQASPRQASHFRDKLGLDPLAVFADDERVSYRAAGLRRWSTTQLVGPRSLGSGIRHSLRSGVVQGRPVGDIAQLGGEMIVLPDGSVPWSHAQENAGDTTAPDDLLATLREKAG